MTAPIPGHECSVYCAGDEHCELLYSTFDHHPSREPPYRSVLGHFDHAYARHYGARVVRCEPAREAAPVTDIDPDNLTPLTPDGPGTWPWLVWFVPPGPAADAEDARREAAYRARLAPFLTPSLREASP